MAGDWIKMRVDLVDDPAVLHIAQTCSMEADLVVGKLHRLWSWADRHTKTGTVPVMGDFVDKFVGCLGFAEAMRSAGWLSFSDEKMTFPRFDKHNGKNAKSRAENTRRQQVSRVRRASVARDEIPPSVRRAVMARDAATCVYCGAVNGDSDCRGGKVSIWLDHIVPAADGGPSTPENLVCACETCNLEKSDRTPDEWGVSPAHMQKGVTYLSREMRVSVTKKRDQRREEKRRVEKSIEDKTPLPPSGGAELFNPLTIELPFQDEAFKVSWNSWVAHRREKRVPLTKTSVQGQLKLLEGLGCDNAIVSIEQSITNGWTGLFPAKPAAGVGARSKARPGEYPEPEYELPILQPGELGSRSAKAGDSKAAL